MSASPEEFRSNRIESERQLKRLQQDVLRMGALVEGSCWMARQALFERNLGVVNQILQQDKKIDQFYRQIEMDCVNIMSTFPPGIQDMRLLSAMMQLVRDLERIGDYAKDLGEIAIKLFPYPPHHCMGQIQIMLDRCRSMLAMSLMSLSNLDAESGLLIKVKDDAVDSDYDLLYDLLAHQSNVQGVVEPIVLMVLIIRHLERIADHATNIGSRVVYIVTGQRS